MREKGFRPECLVDLGRIGALKGIESSANRHVSIGATTTLHEVETSRLVKESCPVLAETVGQIGSVQVRNRGTIGGNLANASPAGDAARALLVLDAELELESASGPRRVPIQSFFVGPGKTALRPGEILGRIIVPASTPLTRTASLKYGPRRAMDCAVVSVAAALRFSPSGACESARVSLGAVSPIPMRAQAAERLLAGGEVTRQKLKAAAEAASAEARPMDDVRASADYRRYLTEILVRRALEKAVDQHHSINIRAK